MVRVCDVSPFFGGLLVLVAPNHCRRIVLHATTSHRAAPVLGPPAPQQAYGGFVPRMPEGWLECPQFGDPIGPFIPMKVLTGQQQAAAAGGEGDTTCTGRCGAPQPAPPSPTHPSPARPAAGAAGPEV